MDEREDYTYLPIEDARKAIGQRVNLFAVVKRIGNPRPCKGPDHVLTLKIIDQSYGAPGLSVNFFAEMPSKLPHVRSCGDLICLRTVMIDLHNGEVYCVFKKRVSSFALFNGKTGEDASPYQTSINFHGFPKDGMLTRRLREWVDKQGFQGLDTGKLVVQTISGIRIGLVFDLVCKVFYVGHNGDGWSFFVWDGSDAPPLNFSSINAEGSNKFLLPGGALCVPRDVLCSFPCVGTILVVISKTFFHEISQLKVGQHWVKLCNLSFEVHDGIWKGFLQATSKIHLLSEVNDHVLIRRRLNQDRMSLESELKFVRQPSACFPWPSKVTDTIHKDARNATLMDSLTCQEVTHKLICVVRVIMAYPWKFEDLLCPDKRQYKVKFVLEDPTARIHALLFGDDAVDFFGGSPPPDGLRTNWNRLLGIGEHENSTLRNPPWVFVCLKSFYTDKKNLWGSRRYCIFDTKLTS